MTFDNEMTNIMIRKLISVMGLSSALLLFLLGIVNIKTTGLPTSASVIAIMFAIGFVVGTLFTDSRNGVYPWTLIGGIIIATTATVIITCIHSGIAFSFTGGIFKINTDLLIYSYSTCMIFSVIALNVVNNLDIVVESINNRMPKDQLDYPAEQYPLHDYNDSDETQEEYKI